MRRDSLQPVETARVQFSATRNFLLKVTCPEDFFEYLQSYSLYFDVGFKNLPYFFLPYGLPVMAYTSCRFIQCRQF